MKYWHIFDVSSFEAYPHSPKISIKASDALGKIFLQQYIAFFPNRYQGWSLLRRTGTPDLQLTHLAINTNGQMPRKDIYRFEEKDAENYQEVTNRLKQEYGTYTRGLVG